MGRFPKTIKIASSAKILYHAMCFFLLGISAINVQLVGADMFSIICIVCFTISAFAACVGKSSVVRNSTRWEDLPKEY